MNIIDSSNIGEVVLVLILQQKSRIKRWLFKVKSDLESQIAYQSIENEKFYNGKLYQLSAVIEFNLLFLPTKQDQVVRSNMVYEIEVRYTSASSHFDSTGGGTWFVAYLFTVHSCGGGQRAACRWDDRLRGWSCFAWKFIDRFLC